MPIVPTRKKVERTTLELHNKIGMQTQSSILNAKDCALLGSYRKIVLF